MPKASETVFVRGASRAQGQDITAELQGCSYAKRGELIGVFYENALRKLGAAESDNITDKVTSGVFRSHFKSYNPPLLTRPCLSWHSANNNDQ